MAEHGAGEPWVTHATDTGAIVRLPDPEHHAGAVSLWSDLDLGPTALDRVDVGWELSLHDLPVDRLEYLLDVDGEHRLDPGNPRVVPGAFGDHSWLPLPSYAEPRWLDLPRAAGERAPARIDDTPVGAIDLEIWAPAGALVDEPLPLLMSHDGPEMAAYGGLLHYVAALVEAGELPRMRVALLEPGARDERYAANPAYTAALTEHVLPHLLTACPTDLPPVLMGQSLGALAALHAAWTSPPTFGGLFLQSGSFFTPETDAMESGYAHFAAITSFVATVLAAHTAAPGAPRMGIVCGSAEENLANNRLLADHLAATGAEVAWGDVRDGHTWTCWRDLLDPHLTTLLRRVWA